MIVDSRTGDTTEPPPRPLPRYCARVRDWPIRRQRCAAWNSPAKRPAAPMRRKGSVTDTPPN